MCNNLANFLLEFIQAIMYIPRYKQSWSNKSLAILPTYQIEPVHWKK